MASELKAQELVHSLELGRGKWWIIFLLICATALLLTLFHVFINPLKAIQKQDSTPLFRGLTHAKGMEQAVIARELSRGNGFSTNVIKPAAIQIVDTKRGEGAFAEFMNPKGPTQGHIPDFYHAPLNPWVNSLAIHGCVALSDSFKLRVDKKGKPDFWPLQQGEFTHPADRIIAALSVIFLFGAIAVNYFIAKAIFDRRLAVILILVLMLCDHFWQFSSTGLPQLLMLFLFSVANLCFVRALTARTENRMAWPWLAGAGLCFGLLALSHALTIWLFVGALVYVAMAFRPHGRDAGIMLGVFLLCFSPWMIRTKQVCGDAMGLGWQTRAYQIRGTESQIMRTLVKADDTVEPTDYKNKLLSQTNAQFDHLYEYLGKIVAAPFFFLALLFAFKRPETRSLRWGVFTMWLFGMFGMSFFGFSDYDLLASQQSNNLHLLFIPMMAAYGLALLLLMWGRVEVDGREISRIRVLNIGFQTAIVAVCAFPLVGTFLNPPRLPISFPPYYPPMIEKLNDWYGDADIICTDMPWAVAWYADRKSLWLPLTIPDFNELNDFRFNQHITGLLLTPVTGFRGLLNDVGIGEFREWSDFIMRNPRARAGFPLSVPKPLPVVSANHYILYADRDRWTERQ